MRTLGLGLLAILATTFALLSNGAPVAAEPTDKEKSEMAAKVYTLLKDKCASCHGADAKKVMGKKGTLNYILDYDKLISEKLIDTASPEKSPLYEEISEGNMPRELDKEGKPKTKKKLAQTEIDLVLNWIKAGAPKWVSAATPASAKFTWSEIKGSGPRGRSHHSMCEGANGSIVVCGGRAKGDGKFSEVIFRDTWVFADGVWTLAQPKARHGASDSSLMAYDAKRAVNVLVNRDMATREFDGKEWTEVKTATQPPARRDFSIAFDAGEGVVLIFGGEQAKGKLLNDCWSYDGKTWKERQFKGAPAARSDAAFTYSHANKAVVLFGGKTAAGPQSDTWLLKGGEWKQESPATSPEAAPYVLMAASTSTTFLVCSNEEGMAGTWIWDGKEWAKGPEGPKARIKGGIAFDGNGKCILLFGGVVGDTYEDSWWQLTEAK